MEPFFYEEIHRADYDRPYIDTEMTDIHYVAHLHEEMEMVVMLEGSVELSADGAAHLLQSGDIAVILPFQIHGMETPTHSRLYIFKLLSPYFDFSAVRLENTVLSPGHTVHARLQEEIQNLVREAALPDDDPVKRLALRSAADRILLTLARLGDIRQISHDRALAHNRDIELLNRINSYLREHYQDNICLDDAARACHLSTYYFAHSFKNATGTTFGSYLNRYRLEQARQKIMEGDAPFTQIAMECGFSTIRTFNRAFLSYYKITPSQAKREWKG